MRFAALLKRIVLRSVREERFLTALSVVGIALGIGLFMGVNVATQKALGSFETNIRGINPTFNYEVVDSSGIDFPEAVYKSVKTIESNCLPILTVNASLPARNETIDIQGIYTIKALALTGLSGEQKVDIENFFKSRNGLLITRKFAQVHNLKKGDAFSAYVYNKQYRLMVVDTINDPLVPENSVFMDLGNFQEYFHKTGLLTRIDLSTDEKKAAEITRVVPPWLTIEKKEQVVQDQKALVDGFRLNLRFVTFLAVLVGVFLLYNTIFISVVKRRTEIGILRGLGMDRKTVVALFSIQGMVLGFAGSMLGIAFGQLFAWFSILAVEKTITRFYQSVVISDFFITGKDVLWALLLGMSVSFLASIVPALESANVRPNESSREGTFERTYKRRQKLLSVIGAIAILCGAAVIYADYRFVPFAFPWLSYAGIVLFIMGCTLNAPAYLGASLEAFRRPAYRMFKASARLAIGDTKGSRYRFSLALMSVAVSSALIVAIVTSVHSLKTSFIDWIDTYIIADVYVKPASCASNFCFSPLADKIVKTVETIPGVEHVGRYRALQLDLLGQKVVAGFGNSELLWKYRPRISPEEKGRIQRLARYREISISDYLKVKYGLKQGDVIHLQTPKGKIAFTINNASISYSTMSGFIYTDRRWLKEYWGLDDATQLSVYLAKGQSVAKFKQQLDHSLGNTYALDVTDNDELRQAVLRIFDKSFALTYSIELIAIVISLIGVVNALLILVFERKREISVLRYLGATWQQIRQVMVVSAGIIGFAGIALGFLMGAVISIVITHVINRISFGWEVSVRMPLPTVFLFMTLLLVTTLSAGLVPSYFARKIDPKAFISYE
ncbi:MAG TPA: FtsX-like permease family protein [Nitrospirota bacterium]|nr:FtsX-like permease family protein [Nitrospirota bacterium]